MATIGEVTDLAQRILDRRLPEGVSEHVARRVLLERKIGAYDQVAQRERGARAREAREHAQRAFEELVEWHRRALRERLGHEQRDVGEVAITLAEVDVAESAAIATALDQVLVDIASDSAKGVAPGGVRPNWPTRN